MLIWDPEWKKFGSGMGKIMIRDKHPPSATMNIPNLLYCRAEVRRLRPQTDRWACGAVSGAACPAWADLPATAAADASADSRGACPSTQGIYIRTLNKR
jgi:hypothetical protein